MRRRCRWARVAPLSRDVGRAPRTALDRIKAAPLPQGASGAAGLAAALCAMHTNKIPPTINLDEPDPDCDLDYVPNEAREARVRIALCNCIGFGSKNSALVVQKIDH